MNETTVHQPDIFAPDVVMVILTWVSFAILVVILKKYAWKPILDTLQKREEYIRKSLDDADKAKVQLQEVDKQKQHILEEAKAQAASIILDARQTASVLAVSIEKKAKEHAEAIVNGAYAQIDGEYQRVSKQLKHESAQTAVLLAGKVLKENLDTDKNRRLVDEAINTL